MSEQVAPVVPIAEPKSVFEDPLMAVLAEDLKFVAAPLKPVAPAPDPAVGIPAPDPAQPPQPAASTVPTTPPLPPTTLDASGVPIKKRDVIGELKTRLDELEQHQQEPIPPAPTATLPDLTKWQEEEIDELEVAKLAEQEMPDKYKGFSQKVVDFKTSHDEWIAKATEENPDREFDANDTEYQDWLTKNRPEIPRPDRIKLERARIARDVRAEVEIAQDKKLREALEVVYVPVIEAAAGSVGTSALDLLSQEPDLKEFADLARTDPKKLSEEHPMEAQAILGVINSFSGLAKRYQRLALKLDDYNPEDKGHTWLAGYVRDAGEFFEKEGGDARKRVTDVDGKPVEQTFLSRGKYAALAQKGDPKAHQHWTYADRDILNLIALQAQRQITGMLKQQWEMLAKAGYKRDRKAASPAPATPSPTPVVAPRSQSPSVTPSSAPGAIPGKSSTPKSGALSWELEALGVANLLPK